MKTAERRKASSNSTSRSVRGPSEEKQDQQQFSVTGSHTRNGDGHVLGSLGLRSSPQFSRRVGAFFSLGFPSQFSACGAPFFVEGSFLS